MKLRLAVIIGSTRNGRFGPTVAGWFAQQAAKRAAFDVDLVDLAVANLPSTMTDTDEPTPAEVAVLAPRLAAADAFAVVTPEYNSSFPAPLKTALDWYYEEWHAKPVAIVAYGRESGGLYAAAQLRQVFTELQAVAIRNTVSLPCYWEQFAADGSWPRSGSGYEAAAKNTLDQLVWWARALRNARTEHPYQP
ncbi:NADPH-dependent FMN reductase [Kribbella sp. VKM Ac-2568]|uniref:NADPH-dependent FMN reductase n=1 Tax=Kribbella sp. VKM Ac-2568 TaxID=2512219 RepID=UPI0010DA8100|nr:NAD(P)H-dependent FMN reductase [Kribbella sp. VKM Ac-2568]